MYIKKSCTRSDVSRRKIIPLYTRDTIIIQIVYWKESRVSDIEISSVTE